MRSVVASLVIAGLSGCADLVGPSPERVVEQFEKVTFLREFSEGEQSLTKWTSPTVSVAAVAPRLDQLSEAAGLDRALERAAALTGLRFARTLPDDSRIRIAFLPRRRFDDLPPALLAGGTQYRRLVSTSACMVLLLRRPDAPDLHGAMVVIASELPQEHRRHCLLEEFVQSLGLPNDHCAYRPSLFCDRDRVLELQPADEILLRTLYSPRLRPGMTRAEAMPIARELISELWAARSRSIRSRASKRLVDAPRAETSR